MTRAPKPTRAVQRQHAEAMLRDLKRAGLKITAPRVAIVHLFASDESHPTAQTLYDRLRGDYPSLSFATVYNTLDALAKAGLSSTLRLGSAARFDPNTAPHHHAVCEGCGAIRDVPAGTLAPTSQSVRRLQGVAPGFSVRSVERIYRGLCATCAAAASTPRVTPTQTTNTSKAAKRTVHPGPSPQP